MKSKLSDSQNKLWTLAQQINDCWHKGNPSELSHFFHEEVVFNSPDFVHQIKGKDNCVQTYFDFLDNSEVLLYNTNNPKVELFDSTGIIAYDFEMKYEQNDKVHHEIGTDILVFQKTENSWKVIWRGLSNLKNKTKK